MRVMLEQVGRDLRHATRVLLKSPGFTLPAVLSLALGIGGNVALFSLINSVLLRPLPYPFPEQLVSVWKWRFPGGGVNASPSDFLAWKESRSFSATAAYVKQTVNLSGRGDPEQLDALRVTPEFFSVLGVHSARGHLSTFAETRNGQERVVVVTDAFSRKQLQAGQIGAAISLNGEPYEIVAVLPKSFTFGNETANLYLPLTVDPAIPLGNSLSVVARLAPGRSVNAAEAELAVIAAGLRSATGDSSRMNPSIVPLRTEIIGDAGSLLLPLVGAVSCVLLISCATLANLLLARTTVRSKEMAVRAALGATRGRLLSQLLVEGVALALAGGLAGLAITQVLLKLVVLTRPKGLPRIEEVGIDLSVLGFTLLLSVVTGIVFGLGPALRDSHTDLESTLREDSRGTTGPARQWLQSSLVVAEIALSLILLIGAGLLLNSFARLVSVKPGFRADHVLTMRITLPVYAYRNRHQVVKFFQESIERVRSIPGVVNVGVANDLPLARGVTHASYTVPGRSMASTEQFENGPSVGPLYYVTPDYLAALGAPIIQGRGLTERDNQIDASPVVVINRSFARQFFGKTGAIGQRVDLTVQKLSCTIVGVVEDMKNGGLGDNQLWLGKPAAPTLYLPHALLPDAMYEPPWNSGRTVFLVLRTTGNPLAMIEPVRRTIWAVDPTQPVADIKTMHDRVMDSVASRKLGMLPLLVFAAVALGLAVGGIYGLVAYAVAQRTREVGIRIALGATRGDVLLLTMKSTIRLALLGIVLGVAGGYWLTRALASQLYGISATDPETYGLVVILLLASVLLASYVPARRATAVDPTLALRYE